MTVEAANTRNAGAPVIELAGVRRSLGEGENAVEVLKGLDLTIRQGEFCSIVGPSGSGKSTLMYLLGALDRPSAGAVRIDGQDTATLADRELAALRNRKLGFIFQFHYLLPEFSALENVMMPMFKLGTPTAEARERAAGLLKQLGLEGKGHRVPGRLSGGEQQRVAIARALANDPPILLADEPTGNLDSSTGHSIIELLMGVNRRRECTLVLVTHDPELASLADETIVLRDGRVVDRRRRTDDVPALQRP